MYPGQRMVESLPDSSQTVYVYLLRCFAVVGSNVEELDFFATGHRRGEAIAAQLCMDARMPCFLMAEGGLPGQHPAESAQ